MDDLECLPPCPSNRSSSSCLHFNDARRRCLPTYRPPTPTFRFAPSTGDASRRYARACPFPTFACHLLLLPAWLPPLTTMHTRTLPRRDASAPLLAATTLASHYAYHCWHASIFTSLFHSCRISTVCLHPSCAFYQRHHSPRYALAAVACLLRPGVDVGGRCHANALYVWAGMALFHGSADLMARQGDDRRRERRRRRL